MPDYEALYNILYNAMTEALEDIDNEHYDLAYIGLLLAQRQTKREIKESSASQQAPVGRS